MIAFDDVIENMIVNTNFKTKFTDLFILHINFHHTLRGGFKEGVEGALPLPLPYFL